MSLKKVVYFFFCTVIQLTASVELVTKLNTFNDYEKATFIFLFLAFALNFY